MNTWQFRQQAMRGRLMAAIPLACAAWLLPASAADGATLRPFRELASNIVRLSDLFDALGQTPDRDLGPSPAPGDRIVVEAPQLAAIASDFGVAWRPKSGAERAVLERGGMPLSDDAVLAPLRRALTAAGAPAQFDIDMPGFTPPVVPAGSHAVPDISDVSYDAGSGRFSALLSLAETDMPSIHTRLTGQAAGVTQAAVLLRHVRPGTALQAGDVREARIRIGALHGNAPLGIDAVIGMALHHDLPPGQPLSAADVTRPVLVARNNLVHMRLEAGGLLLSAQGLALEDGGMGDRVRVQNPSSHAVIIALVTGEAEVRVEPGRAPVLLAAP